MPKGFVLLFLSFPSHIPSDLVWLTLSPEHNLNFSSNWKRCSADKIFDTNTVVSSAYCVSLKVFEFIAMPSMHSFSLIALLRISASRIKRIPDNGHPCLTPLPSLKKLPSVPLCPV